MIFQQLLEWRGYRYLAQMSGLLVFNVDGTKAAEWYVNRPDYHHWYFHQLVQTFPDKIMLFEFKRDIVAPWIQDVDAKLRRDYAKTN